LKFSGAEARRESAFAPGKFEWNWLLLFALRSLVRVLADRYFKFPLKAWLLSSSSSHFKDRRQLNHLRG
jgi:hypothetical protein